MTLRSTDLPVITASHAEPNKGRQMLPKPPLMRSPGSISPLLSPVQGGGMRLRRFLIFSAASPGETQCPRLSRRSRPPKINTFKKNKKTTFFTRPDCRRPLSSPGGRRRVNAEGASDCCCSSVCLTCLSAAVEQRKLPIDKAISACRLSRLPVGEIYRRRQPAGRPAGRSGTSPSSSSSASPGTCWPPCGTAAGCRDLSRLLMKFEVFRQQFPTLYFAVPQTFSTSTEHCT